MNIAQFIEKYGTICRFCQNKMFIEFNVGFVSYSNNDKYATINNQYIQIDGFNYKNESIYINSQTHKTLFVNYYPANPEDQNLNISFHCNNCSLRFTSNNFVIHNYLLQPLSLMKESIYIGKYHIYSNLNLQTTIISSFDSHIFEISLISFLNFKDLNEFYKKIQTAVLFS